jgi:histidine triad (HIT) family protein
MADCLFCGIVAGSIPARVVYEDEHSIAFLDIAPATRGHTLLIPRAHADDLLGLDAAAARDLGGSLLAVAQQVEARLQPAGLNVLQATRAAAWQTVFHLHFHLIPRYDYAELALPWTPTMADGAVLDEVHADLR